MKTSIKKDPLLRSRQKKFLLFLPVILLPFFTSLLWSAGLIGVTEAKASTTSGLNTQLPGAITANNSSWNKLSFYEQADKDSAKYKEELKNDPYYVKGKDTVSIYPKQVSSSGYNPLPPDNPDDNETKVNQKLQELNTILNKPITSDRPNLTQSDYQVTAQHTSSADIDRLEKMLKANNQTDSIADPETEQLNSMMDKILDIQHPERINDKLQNASKENKQKVYTVNKKKTIIQPSLLFKTADTSGTNNRVEKRVVANTFYSLSSDTLSEQDQNAVEAVIEQTQSLVNGAVIKLTIQNEVFISGFRIPAGSSVYGNVSLSSERLLVSVISVRFGNNLLPISMSAYDLDGLEGLYIPGAIGRDVAKQSAGEAMNGLGMVSLDPSLGAQAAGAGIQAAKTLIERKTKQIKVTIKAGYKLLLKDNSDKQ